MNDQRGPTGPAAADETDPIGQNIAAVQAFYSRQAQDLSRSQRMAEHIAGVVGRPGFLLAIVAFAAGWIAANEICAASGGDPLDPAPYFWLQGLVALAALLITTVVLIKQNRVSRLDEQRAHLDLKIALLIEQKVAKMIDLMEELRRDAPGIPNRHDPSAHAMQQAMSPDRVLAALNEAGPGPSTAGGPALRPAEPEDDPV
jgi:uncharacterized membrane protein